MKIREIAREYEIPIMPSPALTRAIFHSTEIGHEIPEGLFAAVAQVLLALVMPVFALFHGWAHGVEATPSAFWQFSAGFVAVSGLLLAAGFAIGCLLRRHSGLQKAFGGGLLAGAALVLAG